MQPEVGMRVWGTHTPPRVGEGSDRIVLLVHPRAAPRGECNQPTNPLSDWAHLVQVRPRKGTYFVSKKYTESSCNLCNLASRVSAGLWSGPGGDQDPSSIPRRPLPHGYQKTSQEEANGPEQ